MYSRINDYAIIGNLSTCALVSLEGSIDWCCMPHLESPAVFCAILDDAAGGRFRIGPTTPGRSKQRYRPDTNILETRFESPHGEVRLTDFMPFGGGEERWDPPLIYRLVEGRRGAMDLSVTFSPRLDYARGATRFDADGTRIAARNGDHAVYLDSPIPLRVGDGVAQAEFTVRAGEQYFFAMRYGRPASGADTLPAALQATHDAWQNWVHRCGGDPCPYEGSGHDLVVRSALTLKLLTHGDTGAVAAAATCSLPEAIGGERNWDYRFAWLRDASFTVQALDLLGHVREGQEFLTWARQIFSRYEDPREIRVLYGLHGERAVRETELEHLEGFKGSRPVRVGNGAADQFQLDVYGELMHVAYELGRYREAVAALEWPFVQALAEMVCTVWRTPDAGIWEMRGPPQHHVYSKVMCWAALDHAVRLSRTLGHAGDRARWTREAEAIRKAVLDEGYDERRGCFVQAFGSSELDASSLLIPIMRFLPGTDPRVRSTIDVIARELSADGVLLKRYEGDRVDDGMAGGEGAFLLCSFWLVSCLALSGQRVRAREIFDTLTGYANHVGLYAEEIDAQTGEFLGNFPQAYTHIGLINAALYLARAEGRIHRGPAPVGAYDTLWMKVRKLLRHGTLR